MELSYPSVKKQKSGDFFIEFTLRSQRIRLKSGRKIKSNLNPNAYPISQKKHKAELLAQQVYNHLLQNDLKFDIFTPKNEIELYDSLVSKKLNEPLSRKYKKAIESIAKHFRGVVLEYKSIPVELTNDYLLQYNNATSFNTIRRHLNAFLSFLSVNGFNAPISSLKPRKQAEKLHRPFDNVSLILDEIKSYNHNLFLCCLLTYGCLLRPHKEVRLIKWGDFSHDLKFLSIDGSRVKSKKNRLVPVPSYISSVLSPTTNENNIFTNKQEPYNHHYFCKLWEKYKKRSKLLKPNETLYSFRHSGAIEIFKRTGSITKLQKAMGHSSINVSLIYLRGLEIPELNEKDMPVL